MSTLNHLDLDLPKLEFWFEFGSNYSYLSVMRIEELARRTQVQVLWRPFLLGPIFSSFGWNNSPFVLQQEKGRYVWQDMRRQATKYGLELRQPSVFPRGAMLPMRVAILGAERPWMAEFCRRVMRQNFVEDLDINEAQNVRRALADLVPDPEAAIVQAQSDANKTRLREQTAAAAARGIFGGPTFFVGDEMFWGDDRMDDAFAYAAQLRHAQLQEQLTLRK
ncbi:2-hydroxychromene-2-carboxylate isomerase [Oxalobacteraceae bacterium]|nr:2-hydroxychromene-2-carboxylate isomerase [Oxalobacteraceae bacterium]